MWNNSWLACSGHIMRGEPASTVLEIFSYFNPFLRRRKTHWMSEFIIFSFFHSPFSFVPKDGTGCVGRVGWPQKIFNQPYPDLKAGHPVP